MSFAYLALGAACLLWLLVLTLHAFETHVWRRTLLTFRLSLPRTLTVDDAVRWFASLAAITHPPQRALFTQPPIVLEVRATPGGTAHYLLVSPALRSQLLATLQANLPGSRLEAAPQERPVQAPLTTASELTMTSRIHPLAVERAESVSAGLLAALQPLQPGEHIIVQLLLTGAGTPPAVSSTRPTGVLARWPPVPAPMDAESFKAARDKQRDPLLAATIRLGAGAATRRRAAKLAARPWGMVQGLNAPGVRLEPRLLPSFITVWRLRRRTYALLRWPLLLNTRELTGLAAFPYGAYLPGLVLGRSCQLPPSPVLAPQGTVVGTSDYPGMASRALALRTDDRLRHLHLIGPTGTGKSTLLANLALQDIAHGSGALVIDPKGDLIGDIAARIPIERTADVVVLDPSEVQTQVVGFNPLQPGSDDGTAERELIADQVLGIFHAIYREFWGPRTDEILRAALFSLVHTRAPDGTAFTLIEVPELLTNRHLRQYVTAQDALPPYLRTFWQWFDISLKDKDRTEAIGPVMNKLRAFSMRSSIRLMLGQSQGIALGEVINRDGILLISLATGKVGAEAASLLGSLFVSALWQAAQTRIHRPPGQRRPFFAYLDEFQEIVRVGADTSLADMLAQARGLGLSLTLAHQYLSQLPVAVREAALNTVGTHIAFPLEWDDARALAARFAPLTSDDLSGLAAHAFAMKALVDGQTQTPVTGWTLPLGEPLHDAVVIARWSREHYGMARPLVEAGLLARSTAVPHSRSDGFGKERGGAAA